MARDEWHNESNDPRDLPPRRDSSRDPWDDERDRPQAKQGMSTGLKVFLILVGIVGVCCVLCCGGILWFGYTMMPQELKDPAKVDAARDEIATIHLPAASSRSKPRK